LREVLLLGRTPAAQRRCWTAVHAVQCRIEFNRDGLALVGSRSENSAGSNDSVELER
jgi:hypothetical protein